MKTFDSSPAGTRILIVLAAALSPLVAGAIIWFSLRRTHRSFAYLGNWISVGSFFLLWPAAALMWRVHPVTNPVSDLLQVIGAGLSGIAVWSARRFDAVAGVPSGFAQQSGGIDDAR